MRDTDIFSLETHSANYMSQHLVEKDSSANCRVGLFPTTSNHQGKYPFSFSLTHRSVQFFVFCFKYLVLICRIMKRFAVHGIGCFSACRFDDNINYISSQLVSELIMQWG